MQWIIIQISYLRSIKFSSVVSCKCLSYGSPKTVFRQSLLTYTISFPFFFFLMQNEMDNLPPTTNYKHLILRVNKKEQGITYMGKLPQKVINDWTSKRTYWRVGTMPDGCLERSTGWLPSKPWSAMFYFSPEKRRIHCFSINSRIDFFELNLDPPLYLYTWLPSSPS